MKKESDLITSIIIVVTVFLIFGFLGFGMMGGYGMMNSYGMMGWNYGYGMNLFGWVIQLLIIIVLILLIFWLFQKVITKK